MQKKKKKIADEFNNFFGTDLENKIPNASKQFDSYIAKINGISTIINQ